MKRFNLNILLLAIFAVIGVELFAQTITKDAITINNLKVGERYTQEQFLQALGTPSKIVPPQEFDEYDNAYTYYFGEDRFYWIDGEFYGLRLSTTAFAVNGLVRVGDPISDIDRLEGIKRYEKTERVQLVNWRPTEGGLYDWLSVDFYYDDRGIITEIMAFINDL